MDNSIAARMQIKFSDSLRRAEVLHLFR